MPVSLSSPSCRTLLPALIVAALASTARSADPKAYDDGKYAFSLTVSEPWTESPLKNYTAPGTIRAAWAGPAASSIVAFVQEPGRAFSPRFLVDQSVKGMEQALGAKASVKDVRTIGGKKAMWMVISGKGTGGALDGKSDVETTQHWVAIPREKDIVVILLTCPAADYEARRPSFEKTLVAMQIKGIQTAEQSEAK